MMGHKWITAAIAALLAFLLALGVCGCLVSAFGLTITDFPGLTGLFALASLFFAWAFSRKKGWLWALMALVPGGWYLCRLGAFWQQLWQLVYRITYVYNKAYQWGVFKLVDTPWNAGTADLPVALLGLLLVLLTTAAVCRGRGAALPVLAALLPMLLCVVVTDTVPAPRYLYLLILGMLLLLLGSHTRRTSAYQGDRLFFLTVLPVALALGILFQAVPQEGYVNRSGDLRERIAAWFRELPEQGGTVLQEMTGSLTTREADTVNLSTLGSRRESTVPVLYAAAETGGALYLRGQDYDLYDGKGWEASPHRVEPFGYAGVNLGYVSVETRRELEQLYLPYYPRDGLSLIGGKYENTRILREYSFIRTGLPDNWQELAAAGEAGLASLPFAAEPEGNHQPYLSLPEQTRLRAEDLLASLLDGHTRTVDKAQAIARYVRGRAMYDKDPLRMPEGQADFALWFLEQGEKGYCVHFATSAAVLLRAAGIPARYVSGYLVPAVPGQSIAVTGEHAHAWAEYYEPGLKAWVILEATPSAGLPALADSPAAQTLPATTAEETAPPETEPPATTIPPETQVPEEAPPARRSLPPLLLWPAGLFLILELQRWLRQSLRRRRQHRGTPNQQGLRYWHEAEALSRALGLSRPEDLEQLAQKAKFSQHTLTGEELAQFQQFLASGKHTLRSQPWYRRLLSRYWLALI